MEKVALEVPEAMGAMMFESSFSKLICFFALFLLLLSSSLVFSAEEDSKFTIVRLKYSGGGDWYSNPSSLYNLLRELRRRCNVGTARRSVVMSLKDDRIFYHPLMYMTGHGNVRFDSRERERLRAYLEHGGFLWADDNYGMDESLRRELKAVFPDNPMVELPFDHPIYSTVYEFSAGLPKIHLHDGGAAKGLGIFVDGRLAVFYSYNTDIGDGLEDPDVHNDPPEKREAAMKMAINIVSYVLSH